MFNFFKKIFKKNHPNKNDLVDDKGNIIQKSAIEYNSGNQRFLRLEDDTCAIVLHNGGNIEVVFTKSYDPNNQEITENEEELMALALFMKQPGFLDMILDEFRKIAKEHIDNLTKDDDR